jgi:hypothetical protein
MTTPSVSATPGSGIPSLAASDASVPPDEIFVYCEEQMDSIDDEAGEYFNQQQSNNQAKAELTSASDAIRNLEVQASSGDNKGTVVDPATVATIQTQLQQVAQQFPAAADKINDAIATLKTDGAGGPGDSKLSTADCDSIINTLTDVGLQIDADNSMGMIRLQSAMSARQQIIELTTNIMQTVSDSGTKVINNIHS